MLCLYLPKKLKSDTVSHLFPIATELSLIYGIQKEGRQSMEVKLGR